MKFFDKKQLRNTIFRTVIAFGLCFLYCWIKPYSISLFFSWEIVLVLVVALIAMHIIMVLLDS
jgi:hypothetical protein